MGRSHRMKYRGVQVLEPGIWKTDKTRQGTLPVWAWWGTGEKGKGLVKE